MKTFIENLRNNKFTQDNKNKNATKFVLGSVYTIVCDDDGNESMADSMLEAYYTLDTTFAIMGEAGIITEDAINKIGNTSIVAAAYVAAYNYYCSDNITSPSRLPIWLYVDKLSSLISYIKDNGIVFDKTVTDAISELSEEYHG